MSQLNQSVSRCTAIRGALFVILGMAITGIGLPGLAAPQAPSTSSYSASPPVMSWPDMSVDGPESLA